MGKITRTVVETTIKASKVEFKNGKVVPVELEPVKVLIKEVKEENALKEVQAVYGKQAQYVITGIEKTETVYGVEFEKFMEIAEVIERPASQQKKQEEI